MTELKELLSEYLTTVRFEDSEIEDLKRIAVTIECQQGELLFEASDPGDSVYLVISGAIDLFAKSSDNFEQTILSVRAGGFVGAVALIDDDVREINARAYETASLYKFDRDKLTQLISEGNTLGTKLLRMLAGILNKRLRIVMNSLQQNLEWTMQVSGLANLDMSQLIVDQVNIEIDLINGKQLSGIIMKAEEHAAGQELFVKTDDGKLHFIPYHAIVSASLPLGTIRSDTTKTSGM